MDYICRVNSPMGEITLASDGEALTGLWFEGQKYYGATLDEVEERELAIFDDVRDWLERYFRGDEPKVDMLLRPRGSEFRQAVWRVLLEIPYGEVTTYGEIARNLGCKSAQAIGGAVGHNPISIIIPCHRVVGSDGSLTGYAGGVDKKEWLLQLEGVTF